MRGSEGIGGITGQGGLRALGGSEGVRAAEEAAGSNLGGLRLE